MAKLFTMVKETEDYLKIRKETLDSYDRRRCRDNHRDRAEKVLYPEN